MENNNTNSYKVVRITALARVIIGESAYRIYPKKLAYTQKSLNETVKSFIDALCDSARENIVNPYIDRSTWQKRFERTPTGLNFKQLRRLVAAYQDKPDNTSLKPNAEMADYIVAQIRTAAIDECRAALKGKMVFCAADGVGGRGSHKPVNILPDQPTKDAIDTPIK